MKNRELIKKLLEFNMDAEVNVIAHCKEYPFTLSWSGDGTDSIMDNKKITKDVNFYIDDLCNNDNTNKR